MANLNASKNLNLSRLADRLVDDVERINQLKAIANKKNYPLKIKQLHARISQEFDFWNKKGPSNRLSDLKHDLDFIQLQIETEEVNKIKVDRLASKYL